MSAIVCGKRSSSFFEELHHHQPSSPPSASKRIRCSSPIRFSHPRANSVLLGRLRSLFPHMEQQLLERALEASDDDLDSAIKSLNELCIGSTDRKFDFTVDKTVAGTSIQLASEGAIVNNADYGVCGNPSGMENLPADGSEWVELFVREMMNASDMDDARARASRVLEVLEKNIKACANAGAAESFHEENLILKEQVEALLRDNNILKRAVAIQHERQKEFDARNQELQHLKQLVSQYQEQVRTLEVNNYALTLHLRQAQQSSSIPGQFHPDVF